eukprot:337045_1
MGGISSQTTDSIIKSGNVKIQFSVDDNPRSFWISMTSTELSIYEDKLSNSPLILINLKDLLNIDTNNNDFCQLLFNDSHYPTITIYCDSKLDMKYWISLFKKCCQNVILTKELQMVKKCAKDLGFNSTEIEAALVKYHEKYNTMYNIHEFVHFVAQQRADSESKMIDQKLGSKSTYDDYNQAKYLLLMNDKCLAKPSKCCHVRRVIGILHEFEAFASSNQKFPSISSYLFSSQQHKKRIYLMRDFAHIQQHHSHSDFDRIFYRMNLKHHCNQQEENLCDKERRHRNRYKTINMHNEQEINDINLIQLLDTIHCSLLHNTVNVSNTSKFITEISNVNDDIIDEAKYQSQYENLPKYHFGEAFNTDSKYANLKQEFLLNCLYPLNLKQYESLAAKANDFIECYQQQLLCAKREAEYKSNIHYGDPITVEHVMAVMSYCNIDNLQSSFKNGFRITDKCENMIDIKGKQSEIAIWTRLVLESVVLFGEQFTYDDTVYHGLNSKLQFDHLSAVFSMPTSTTVSLAVAQRFAINVNNGIILEMTTSAPNAARNCYLDVYSTFIFSDYPNEKERLIFGTGMAFNNIIYQDDYSKLGHREEIMSLRLYQAIIYGLYYTHRKNDIFTEKHQQNIIQYMNIMMNKCDNKHNVDEYIIYLFQCISVNAKFISIIRTEFEQLLDELQRLFWHDFSPFLARKFDKQYPCYANVRKITTSIETISAASTESFFNQGTGIKRLIYQSNKNDPIDIYVVFKTKYEQLEKKTYLDASIITTKHMGHAVIDIILLVWIEEIHFDNYLDGKLTSSNLCHSSRMCEMSKFAHMNKNQLFDIKVVIHQINIKMNEEQYMKYYYNTGLSNCTVPAQIRYQNTCIINADMLKDIIPNDALISKEKT